MIDGARFMRGLFRANKNITATSRPIRARDNMEERVFLRTWKKANRRVLHMNSGYTLLELLLNTNPIRTPAPGFKIKDQLADLSCRPSKRDMLVAASVIQWLGTKEGLIFMRHCEKEIKQNKKKMQRIFHRKFNMDQRTRNEKNSAYIGTANC